MNIKVLSAKKYAQKLKVTIQASGKLGFSDETANEFGLKTRSVYFKFFIDDDSQDMYLSVLDQRDEDAFKANKSGVYYSLPTTQMFNDLKVDYKNKTVIFDLIRRSDHDSELGGAVYQMNPRILERRQKDVK